MIIQNSFIEINEKYHTGIAIDKFNNEFSIVACFRNNGGDVKARWGHPQGKAGPSEKAIPWCITMGVKEQAVQIMEKLIYAIERRTKRSD